MNDPDCPWCEEEIDERERLELQLTRTFEGGYRFAEDKEDER